MRRAYESLMQRSSGPKLNFVEWQGLIRQLYYKCILDRLRRLNPLVVFKHIKHRPFVPRNCGDFCCSQPLGFPRINGDARLLAIADKWRTAVIFRCASLARS
jgi:hypothetical protein